MNTLLLIFDDLVPLLGCYGVSYAQTPNIDRLAARGVTFTEAYTPCAICSAGRATLFTGLHPDTHGVTNLHGKLRGRLPEVVTWPQHLREHGYYTMRSGKVYHKGVPDTVCIRTDGDDDPKSWCERSNPPAFELNTWGAFRNLTPAETHTVSMGGAIAWLRSENADRHHHDWQVANEVIEAIENRDRARSSLWAAGFIRPHVPLVAPKQFFELYDHTTIPPLVEPEGTTPVPEQIRRHWCGAFNLPEEARQLAVRAYLACVSFVDAQIGRILDALDNHGIADETLIILTSDHGYQLGEHGLWFKNFLYRESSRIPLIVADPRISATHGSSCDALVDQTDVFPTLCRLLELPAPVGQALEGHDLVPLLEDPNAKVRDHITTQVDWRQVQGRCVRTKNHAYLRWTGVAHDVEQLYDLKADPGEHINRLHGGATHPARHGLAEQLGAG